MAGTPAGMAGGGAGTPASAKRVRNTPVTGLSEAERSSAQLAALAEYLEACGGSASMVDGWYTKTETRSTGSTAGTYDTYFFHPSGKRFRSRAEIARYFELQAAPAPRRSADAQARADAKAALKQEKAEARSAEAAERDAQRQKEIEYARRYPCADALLADDDAPEPPLGARPPPAPLPAGVDGVPSAAVGDLLQCWHFVASVGPDLEAALVRAGSEEARACRGSRSAPWRATSTRGATTSRTRCATSASFFSRSPSTTLAPPDGGRARASSPARRRRRRRRRRAAPPAARGAGGSRGSTWRRSR